MIFRIAAFTDPLTTCILFYFASLVLCAKHKLTQNDFDEQLTHMLHAYSFFYSYIRNGRMLHIEVVSEACMDY